MERLWDYCACCGKRIEVGEKCYGLSNGDSVCTDCVVAENEGAAVSDGEEEQEELTMAEYISRQKALEEIHKWCDPCGSGIEAILAVLTADVVPAVYGRWVHLGGDEWCCSACGFVITTEGSWEKPTKKYCEDCGAKMAREE